MLIHDTLSRRVSQAIVSNSNRTLTCLWRWREGGNDQGGGFGGLGGRGRADVISGGHRRAKDLAGRDAADVFAGTHDAQHGAGELVGCVVIAFANFLKHF